MNKRIVSTLNRSNTMRPDSFNKSDEELQPHKYTKLLQNKQNIQCLEGHVNDDDSEIMKFGSTKAPDVRDKPTLGADTNSASPFTLGPNARSCSIAAQPSPDVTVRFGWSATCVGQTGGMEDSGSVSPFPVSAAKHH